MTIYRSDCARSHPFLKHGALRLDAIEHSGLFPYETWAVIVSNASIHMGGDVPVGSAACASLEDGRSALVNASSEQLLHEIAASLARQQEIGCLCVSAVCDTLEELQPLYDEARRYIRLSSLWPRGAVMFVARERDKPRQILPAGQTMTACFLRLYTLDESYCAQLVETTLYDETGLDHSVIGLEKYVNGLMSILHTIAICHGVDLSVLNTDWHFLHSPGELRALILRLYGYIVRSFSGSARHESIRWSLRYIEENLANKISMTVIANHLDLNYSYYSQLFKTETGKDFSDYVRDMRMRRAVGLILAGCSVASTAEKVGYSNAKNFSRAFRRKYGISPAECRARPYEIDKAQIDDEQ